MMTAMRTKALLSSDTSLEAENRQVEHWRRMSPMQKLQIVDELNRAVDDLSLAGIRMRHPGASERECFLRLAVLKWGRKDACRVYPEAAQLIGR